MQELMKLTNSNLKFLNLKYLILLVPTVLVLLGIINKPIESGVYSFAALSQGDVEINGSTQHFEYMKMSAGSLKSGEALRDTDFLKDLEKLFIIKKGEFEVTLRGQTKTLGKNSIALILPEEKFEITSSGGEFSEYYLMQYQSKNTTDLERGEKEGGSFMIDFEELEYNTHDRGGIRNYYNRPTAMTEYFEMHVTNLNGMIKSHEPHTHGAAEIVLMIKGNTEMEIGDGFYQGSTDDIYFLESEIPHAIENITEEQVMYFAFQWE